MAPARGAQGVRRSETKVRREKLDLIVESGAQQKGGYTEQSTGKKTQREGHECVEARNSAPVVNPKCDEEGAPSDDVESPDELRRKAGQRMHSRNRNQRIAVLFRSFVPLVHHDEARLHRVLEEGVHGRLCEVGRDAPLVPPACKTDKRTHRQREEWRHPRRRLQLDARDRQRQRQRRQHERQLEDARTRVRRRQHVRECAAPLRRRCASFAQPARDRRRKHDEAGHQADRKYRSSAGNGKDLPFEHGTND
mmetsp:Transcript_9311/g.20388  ORF Transcript_9311/g.20388 Transcript_9311/m.20388 type:complete len:251 (-) Transcript_9311:1005-1757(-)